MPTDPGRPPDTPDAAQPGGVEAVRAFFESIVATVREPLVVLDEGLAVVLANRAFYSTFGVDPADTAGRLLYDLGNGQWRIPALRHLLEDVLPHNAHFDDFEVTHSFERIGRRTMLLNARKIHRPGNNSRLILLAIEDVTERRSIEAALRERNDELALRNRELDDFTYTVSHDLKSPLVTIGGRIALLRRHLAAGDAEAAQHALGRIELSSERMGRLIEDLLRLSRSGQVKGTPVAVNVAALVRTLWDGIAPADGSCTLAVEPDLPGVVADAERVAEVFENVLANAVKYGCSAGGAHVRVGAQVEAGELRYSVADDGPGIEPAYHERVFGLFQRLVTDQDGTGIGLAIVAKVMRAYNGRAWVTSEPGAGATFWLAFPEAALVPRAPDSAPHPASVSALDPDSPGHGR